MKTPVKKTSQQVARARLLRRRMTFPERVLWGLLRNHRLDRIHFRRQHPVGSYVLDFACVKLKLAVELDGMSHMGTGQKDDRRTARLGKQGWQVLRFTNDQVLEDRFAVGEAIAAACRAIMPLPIPDSPLPASPASGGGEKQCGNRLTTSLHPLPTSPASPGGGGGEYSHHPKQEINSP